MITIFLRFHSRFQYWLYTSVTERLQRGGYLGSRNLQRPLVRILLLLLDHLTLNLKHCPNHLNTAITEQPTLDHNHMPSSCIHSNEPTNQTQSELKQRQSHTKRITYRSFFNFSRCFISSRIVRARSKFSRSSRILWNDFLSFFRT